MNARTVFLVAGVAVEVICVALFVLGIVGGPTDEWTARSLMIILGTGGAIGVASMLLQDYLPRPLLQKGETIGAGMLAVLGVVGGISILGAERGSIVLKLTIALLVGGGLTALGVAGVIDSFRAGDGRRHRGLGEGPAPDCVEPGGMAGRRFLVASLAALALLSSSLPGAPAAADRRGPPEMVGAFFVGAPLSGAVLHEGYLYITTSDRVSIYDTSEPAIPRLVGTAPSPRTIYGELLSTDGETLLLNNGLAAGTLDVWDVEDKTNPQLAATLNGVNDEHVSCLHECSWAYGSNGTILDLRKPNAPVIQDVNWKEEAGIKAYLHRVDEYRKGFMFTAPRQGKPRALDVRDPLHPNVIASAQVPTLFPNPFLFTHWTAQGRGRFVIASTETGSCRDENQGAMITFDTQGWPRDTNFEMIDNFKYRGRTDSNEDGCTAYYYALHPNFDDGGTVLLPSGLEGIRIVEISTEGEISELDSFVPIISDVWLAFWGSDEIFYALNTTGEVYVLRYL